MGKLEDRCEAAEIEDLADGRAIALIEDPGDQEALAEFLVEDEAECAAEDGE